MPDTYEVKVRPEKVAAADEIKQAIDAADAIVLTEYRGLTVGEIGSLRSELRKADVAYRVVKNTLARRAASDAGLDGLEGLFVGPTAIAYCHGDPVSAAKALVDFAEEHPALVIKGAVLDGQLMTPEQTEELAKVDPLEVSLAKISGLLQAALQQIVGILEAPLSRILFVIEQGVSQGDAGPFAGSGPAEPEPPAEPPAAAEDGDPTDTEAPTEGQDAAADGEEGGE